MVEPMVKRVRYIKPSPLTTAEMMKRMRTARKEAGLVEVHTWVTPDDKITLDKFIKKLTEDY